MTTQFMLSIWTEQEFIRKKHIVRPTCLVPIIQHVLDKTGKYADTKIVSSGRASRPYPHMMRSSTKFEVDWISKLSANTQNNRK